MNDFLENIRMIQHEKNISEELVLKNIESALKAAYKKRFGTDENAVVQFHEGYSGISLYAQKRIVADEELEDEVLEVALSEAQGHNREAEIGDELLFELDLKNDFGRGAVDNAKQRSRQGLREIQKDTLYSEFHEKLGGLIIGYNQRERNGNVYINLGKTEGILPKRFQSPREIYRPGDRIKVLIEDVRRHSQGLQIVLSRSSPELVRKLFEIEVSEIYDGTVEIYKVVREAGWRTKMAVYSYRDDIDPVGACVGLKGSRIQNVIRELEGEKIDVLHYASNPADFIKSALAPAQVEQVQIISNRRKAALAVVPGEQLSLAIGKQGVNIRLACRLVGWSIDVKTPEQFLEMKLQPEQDEQAADLFAELQGEEGAAEFGSPENAENFANIVSLSDLEGMNEELLALLASKNISEIEQLQELSLHDVEVLLKGEEIRLIEAVQGVIDINADAIDSYVSPGSEEMVIYQCPECSHEIDISMTECPSCHVGLSFEEEE